MKFLSRLLVLALLTVTLNGVWESAHAVQDCVSAASDRASSPSTISAADPCPCCPVGHDDLDGCDVCVNCACQASMTTQLFQVSYRPSVLELGTSEPFKHLPELYLPKFIPPQNLV